MPLFLAVTAPVLTAASTSTAGMIATSLGVAVGAGLTSYWWYLYNGSWSIISGEYIALLRAQANMTIAHIDEVGNQVDSSLNAIDAASQDIQTHVVQLEETVDKIKKSNEHLTETAIPSMKKMYEGMHGHLTETTQQFCALTQQLTSRENYMAQAAASIHTQTEIIASQQTIINQLGECVNLLQSENDELIKTIEEQRATTERLRQINFFFKEKALQTLPRQDHVPTFLTASVA